jgi:hypothetical protein
VGPAGFAISILVLLFIGRTFNNYYLLWPLMGAAIATVMAAGEASSAPRDDQHSAAVGRPAARGRASRG